MQTVHRIAELRALVAGRRQAGKRIALVPTMGQPASGSSSLGGSRQNPGDYSVASIFVNPMQFGPRRISTVIPALWRQTAANSRRWDWTCCSLPDR